MAATTIAYPRHSIQIDSIIKYLKITTKIILYKLLIYSIKYFIMIYNQDVNHYVINTALRVVQIETKKQICQLCSL